MSRPHNLKEPPLQRLPGDRQEGTKWTALLLIDNVATGSDDLRRCIRCAAAWLSKASSFCGRQAKIEDLYLCLVPFMTVHANVDDAWVLCLLGREWSALQILILTLCSGRPQKSIWGGGLP